MWMCKENCSVASLALKTLKLTQIVIIRTTLLETSISANYVVFKDGKQNPQEFMYKKTGNGCTFEFEGRKEIFKNQDYLALFFSHLKTILFPYTIISELSFSLVNNDVESGARTLEAIKNTLSSKKPSLKINELVFSFSGQPMFAPAIAITETLDSGPLKSIHLSTDKEEEMDCDGLTKLPHWKRIKSLLIEGFIVSAPLEHFLHLPEVTITMQSITIFNLKLLKKHFLGLKSEKKFVLKYKLDDGEIADNVHAVFEQASSTCEGIIKQWVYPKNGNMEIRVEYRQHHGFKDHKFTFIALRESQEQSILLTVD
ncbi:DUF38 domain-containing protein [Caenorhabditis elegans]|uniref:DUF38 domain-containing protein n=1 Tax=Caenorhabditis elegans TaxID=6239 RepID=O17998_CAEEL|nr:DUF38 domain-containing protein [Caenorhabditis elegans]CAB04643.2 DUF38 domain-containing protein [Caenorhabditis elegans]|eukprot:NP_507568.2 Uncharacterized protein CELE_R10E8.1 [Caenorhabditis elegans]